MSTELFPTDPVAEYLFEVKYDGPSFNGVMEIRALAEEILGMDACIHGIISALRKDKRIALKEADFQLLVEAFENNCFKKKIQLIVDAIEKYPQTAETIRGIVGGVFGTVITVILANSAIQICEMSPELRAKVSDETAATLLSDSRFLKNISRTIIPLRKEGDLVSIKTPDLSAPELIIPFSERGKFLMLGGEETIEEEIEQRHPDDMYGKIISMDLDAKKNQVDFKIGGEGERIHCTFSDNLNVQDYIHLLGKWVTVEGEVEKTNGNATHFYIEKIEKNDPPASEKQGDIFEDGGAVG